ncbi:MAG: biotin--[acetyl-CoA-carboxylase] ligase [Candidatus Riflebacteria bacterium]|nr:biotin--[acetyl-CoA-carboxylase] ligase [Candidatus Riflebacteria bacterium]
MNPQGTGDPPLPPEWCGFPDLLHRLDGFGGHRFQFVEVTRSTNDDLKHAWSDPGIPAPPMVLVAGHQTAGRGRVERAWHDAPGCSLLCSFSWSWPLTDFSRFSLNPALGMALAMHRAFSRMGTPSRPIELKWPNDLMVGTDKLGGVLVDATLQGKTMHVVIGFGVNCRPLLEDHPPPMTNSFNPISLAELGLPASLPGCLQRVLAAWAGVAPYLSDPALLREFKAHGGRFWGAPSTAWLPDGTRVQGRPVDLLRGGALAFRTADGRLLTLSSVHRILPET